MQSSNVRPRESGGGSESWADNGWRPASAAPVAGEPAYEDPWYDLLAPGWGESVGRGTPAPGPAVVPAARQEQEVPAVRAADVYLEVQRSAAFQEVRRRYRRFVGPGTAAFLSWYVGYVVMATTAPGLMARPVAGVVNVAMIAGLGQFFTTFLLTWAYALHARLRRDRAALELRWDTQELTRGMEGGKR
ncbi:DUF485 domain-containing protein [Streptomyces sp. YIM S03343]